MRVKGREWGRRRKHPEEKGGGRCGGGGGYSVKERKKTGREESDEKARQGKVMSFVLRPCKVAPTVPPSLLITSVAVMNDTALHTQSASLGGGGTASAPPVEADAANMWVEVCGRSAPSHSFCHIPGPFFSILNIHYNISSKSSH